MRFRWLGTACFQFELPQGQTLIVDPYMDAAINSPVRTEEIQRVDVICITHGHFDHLLDVGRLAELSDAEVICSRRVAQTVVEQFRVPRTQIQTVSPGEILKRCDIRIEVVPAVHVDNRRFFAEQLGVPVTDEVGTEGIVRQLFQTIEPAELRDQFLSYLGKYPAGEQLNFIFRFPGNLTCYFCGSTPDPHIYGVAEQSRAQILFLQILSGREDAAADLARRSGAAVVIPTHHDAFFPGQRVPEVHRVAQLLDAIPHTEFLDPEPGQWYEIAVTAEWSANHGPEKTS